MKVKCPSCSHVFNIIIEGGRVANPKGMGKKTGKLQSKLSRKQMDCLRAVETMGAVNVASGVTNRMVYERLKDTAMKNNTRFPSTAFVSFWLSALLGAGFLKMANKKCEVKDYPTQDIKFVKKPVWYLSDSYRNGELSLTVDGTIIRKVLQ